MIINHVSLAASLRCVAVLAVLASSRGKALQSGDAEPMKVALSVNRIDGVFTPPS